MIRLILLLIILITINELYLAFHHHHNHYKRIYKNDQITSLMNDIRRKTISTSISTSTSTITTSLQLSTRQKGVFTEGLILDDFDHILDAIYIFKKAFGNYYYH